jgi:hypothetical protein
MALAVFTSRPEGSVFYKLLYAHCFSDVNGDAVYLMLVPDTCDQRFSNAFAFMDARGCLYLATRTFKVLNAEPFGVDLWEVFTDDSTMSMLLVPTGTARPRTSEGLPYPRVTFSRLPFEEHDSSQSSL